jgi:hypothetical protein
VGSPNSGSAASESVMAGNVQAEPGFGARMARLSPAKARVVRKNVAAIAPASPSPGGSPAPAGARDR